jgi:hypothetical protein
VKIPPDVLVLFMKRSSMDAYCELGTITTTSHTLVSRTEKAQSSTDGLTVGSEISLHRNTNQGTGFFQMSRRKTNRKCI